jgi:methanogenic corrinoid protein MtbC1
MLAGREPRIQPPILDAYSDTPLFNSKAVVHNTGVPAPTLRAWERRYGILSPRRGENDYRLYSERDIVLVSWLRERVESGMTISQAIALLRSLERPRRRKTRGRTLSIALAQSPNGAAPAVGERLAASDLTAALVAHCARLDERGAVRTIAQALAVHSIEDVCRLVLAPAMEEIGSLWAVGQVTVTVEHFATAVVRAQLEGLFRAAAAEQDGPWVLVGCAPGEQHELGALILALFLRRSGLRVAYLGQNVEPDHLLASVESTRPACVALSASMRPAVDELARLGQRLSRDDRRQPLFCFGGQAFAADATLADGIPGDYIAGDALTAVTEIKKKLSA